MKSELTVFGSAVLFFTLSASGQEAPKRGEVPIYNVTVVERTTKAINYQYRSGPTIIDFRGTVLMTEAKGEATVESKRGRTEIDLRVDNLVPPTRFGHEYLTYTLWAITPEGGPHNIGEVIPNGGNKVRMHVTTDLQAFGLIITAEPHSAARQPSDVVVLENQVRPDTMGMVKEIQAKYELMPRGHYTWDVANKFDPKIANMPKVSMDQYEATLELYEAQNANGIARAANADQYAPQTFARSQQLLADAQRMQDTKAPASMVVQVAREAAQTAEDARVIAEKRRQEDRVTTAEAAVAQAKEAQARAEAEAQRMRTEADAARSQAAAERNSRDRAEVETADARQRLAQQSAIIAAPPPAPPVSTVPQVDTQKTELRMRLVEQLNGVLPARDTPRGLVATVSDANFNGGELRGPAANQVARLVTILAPYANLRVTVEGHCDSPSSQAQSAKRAEAVGRILVANGLRPDRATTLSLGDSRPLVSNNSSAGREQNRRVEIVISGDAIGTLPFWDRTYSLLQRR
jgi:outer membrane protein OmpA-like peptidoglycan-associated protein